MKIRLYNARVLTMAEGEDIYMGEVHINDNRITYTGPAFNTEGLVFDREIDCEGNVLLPGFKNCHTHSGMTAFRSLADDLNLQDWLFKEIFPREAKMDGEDCYWFTKLAILEYLTTGVTAIQDMYLTPETISDACIEMGMRCEIVSGLNKFGPTLEVLEERYNSLNKKHPLIGFQMGIHAEYTCDKELLEKVSEIVHKYKSPFYVHVSETKTEHEECIERYNMTPLAFMDSLGLFDFGGVIYHGCYITEADMEIMKKRGIMVVSNPGSNGKLASGIAPITDYMNMGITVALGTDGASSNNALDMFREMYLVTVFGKIREHDPLAVPATEVLKMATVNGSKTMEHTDTDILAPGKLADIIMVDLNQPNMQPILNIPNNIVYSGSKSNIKMTMIDGKILYENGEFIGVNVQEIYDKTAAIMEKLR